MKSVARAKIMGIVALLYGLLSVYSWIAVSYYDMLFIVNTVVISLLVITGFITLRKIRHLDFREKPYIIVLLVLFSYITTEAFLLFLLGVYDMFSTIITMSMGIVMINYGFKYLSKSKEEQAKREKLKKQNKTIILKKNNIRY